MIVCQVAGGSTGKVEDGSSGSKTSSPQTHRSPLTRQQVLTHRRRRHVVVTKSTSLPLDQKADVPSDTASGRMHCDTGRSMSDAYRNRRDPTMKSDAESLASDKHLNAGDDDPLWNKNREDLPPESAEMEAVFVPGRLLGTSDSFCVKSLHSLPTGHFAMHQEAIVEQNDEESLSHVNPKHPLHSAVASDSPDSAVSDNENDAFDEEPAEQHHPTAASVPFLRRTHLQRRKHVRRPLTDHE